MPPGFRVIRFAISVAALLLASHAAVAASGGELLVLEKGSNTLAIIDPRTLQVLARVAAGPDPHEVVDQRTAAVRTSPTTAARAAI